MGREEYKCVLLVRSFVFYLVFGGFGIELRGLREKKG